MAKMKAIEAAVEVLKREGVDITFGVPGAAINPFYAAMKKIGGIDHVLARHVEGAREVDRDGPLEERGIVGRALGDELGPGRDARAIDDDAGGAQLGHHPVHRRGDAVGIGDIGGDEEAPEFAGPRRPARAREPPVRTSPRRCRPHRGG